MTDVTNRENVRDALYALLNSGLVGSGKWVQVAFPYAPDDEELDGRSPALWVSSGPIQRGNITIASRKRTTVTLLVHWVVKMTDDTAASVEDRLDKIEKELSDILLLEANQSNSTWQRMEPQQSNTLYWSIGGAEYRVEVLPVEFTLRND